MIPQPHSGANHMLFVSSEGAPDFHLNFSYLFLTLVSSLVRLINATRVASTAMPLAIHSCLHPRDNGYPHL
jgi:hypothetical protein